MYATFPLFFDYHYSLAYKQETMESKHLHKNLSAGEPKASRAIHYRSKRNKSNATDLLFMLRLYSACIKNASNPKDFQEGVSEFRRIMWNVK